MATINEEARIPVYINDEQVKSSLKTLTAQAEKWRKTMREAMAAGDLKGVKAAEGELKKVNRQVQEIKRTSFDVNKVLNNLSSASAKDLRKALSAVNKEMQGLNRNSKEYNELARKSKMLSGEIQSINAQTKALTSNVSASGKSMGMFGSLLPIASVSTLIFGLGRLGGELFDLSKRMEADNIRSNQVFGESLDYVSKEAENLSRKMGMTNREFVAAATATGDLLIPLDFTREQAAQMSVELQSLSGALDEWTGGEIGAAGVSEILTKAMLGENEQLKQLGIAIRKDSDEYRDLVKQKEAAGNVTKAQAEAMATLELIQRKSTDAQAAYNHEGNKLLRWQKSVSAGWRQMKEDFVAFFNVSEAGKLEEQRKQVNLLTIQLYDNNIQGERREELLKRLNTLAPKVAESFNSEKQATEETRKALALYNDEMILKIALAHKDEELQDTIEKAGKKRRDYIDKEQLAISLMIKRYESLKKDFEGGFLGNTKVEDYKKLEEIVSSSMSTAEKMDELSRLNIFDQFDKTTFKNYGDWIREAENKSNEMQDVVTKLEEERQRLYQQYGIKRPEDPGPETPPEPTNNNSTTPSAPAKVKPIDLSKIESDYEKSYKDMEALEEKHLNEFTKKWTDYQNLRSSYGLETEKTTHEQTLAMLDGFFQERMITEQEYVEARRAILDMVDNEERARLIKNREYEFELKQMDIEQDQLNFETQLALEEERYNILTDIEAQRYALEKEKAKQNKDELLRIEVEHKKKLKSLDQDHIRSKEGIVNKEMELQLARLDIAQSILGGIATVYGEENKFAQAALVAKQGVALAEAAMALGVGKAKTAAVGFPQNVPLIAAFIAQTAGFISSIKGVLKGKGRKTGGFTDTDSTDDKVVDYVHSNEFVATADAVRNPTIKPVLDLIDIAQKNGSIAQLNLPSIMQQSGRKTGGFTSESSASQPAAVQYALPPEIADLLRNTNETLLQLKNNGVKGVWDWDYDKRSRAKMENIQEDVRT